MAKEKTASQENVTKNIRVTVVAENRMVATLLRDVLSRFPGCDVETALTGCSEALATASNNPSDVTVIHQNLEGEPLKGLHLARLLLSASPAIKPVIVVDSDHCEVIAETFQSGARGIFHQGEPIESLWECICQVSEGKIYASQADISCLVQTLVDSPPLRLLNTQGRAILTNREQDVARWVIEGYSNREIAEKLKLSEHTIKNYLFRIFDRLGVSNRAEMTLYVLSRRAHVFRPQTKSEEEETPSNGSLLSSYFKEAQAGHPAAQLRLGEVYNRGQDVPKDRVASFMWLTIAERSAASVLEEAEAVRNRLAAKMTNSDIAAAQSRAAKWWTKFAGRNGAGWQGEGSELGAGGALEDPRGETDRDNALPLAGNAQA